MSIIYYIKTDQKLIIFSIKKRLYREKSYALRKYYIFNIFGFQFFLYHDLTYKNIKYFPIYKIII